MLEFSYGNHKIGKDTLIFNMGSATNCPSRARGLCKIPPGLCYALKAERQWPCVLPYRTRQARAWASSKAYTIAWDFIMAIRKRKTATKFIRFSEAGDFRGQCDIDKLADIAEITGPALPKVKIYGHTARADLNFNNLPDNVTVNGSGFMLDNSFTAVKSYINKDRAGGRITFKCYGDCRLCNACKYRKHSIILNQYH